MTPEELVQTACPLFNELGWTFYFTPETTAMGEAIGLDVFELYFLGRGGVLGDVPWQVVDAAFGYFKPAVVESMWTKASGKVAPTRAAEVYLAACQDHGRRLLGGVDGLAAFCAAAEALCAASPLAAAPLFGGYLAHPLADDLPARAMQLVTTLREHRGGVHLAAVVAAGLAPVVAHAIRRPDMMAMFGWAPEDTPVALGVHHDQLRAADEMTDVALVQCAAALDADGREALAQGLTSIKVALA